MVGARGRAVWSRWAALGDNVVKMTDISSFSHRIFEFSRYSGLPNHALRGFSLIEVMVAIVILAFGVMGAVGMQAFALQANRDARLQAQAAGLARELAEMMRGNKKIAVDTASANNPYLGEWGSPITVTSADYCLSVANAATGCATTLNVARAEMTDWLSRVKAELPGARVSVCFDSAPYDANGLAQWACTTAGADMTYIKIGWTRASTDKSPTASSPLEMASDRGSRPSVIFPAASGNAT